MKLFRVWLYFNFYYYKDAIKPYLKPTMFISFGIAYFITNLWAYLFLLIGTSFMKKIALSYIAFLWLPISPEKIVTVAIALWIQKNIFKEAKNES